jgi:5,10-methylenetetrahydromethanopterin reductase
VKALLAGKTVDFHGTPGRLGYASGREIPVLMAASGAKAIELAGEVADGVLLLVGFNRGIVERALEHVERGARRAGRRLEDLEIIWAVRTATKPTTAEARRVARPTAVHWGVLRWGGYWLEPAGVRLPKLEIPDAVKNVYPDLSHAHDWEAAIAATSFVPDAAVAELCDALGLVGTPADCVARIVEMTSLGVRNLYLMPLLTFAPPDAEIAAFRDTVFPRLRAAGLRPPS